MKTDFVVSALSPAQLSLANKAYNELAEIVARAVHGYARLPPVFPRSKDRE